MPETTAQQPTPILHHFDFKKIVILLGLLLLTFLIAITPMYIKNYKELKNYYAKQPTVEINEEFLQIEFAKNGERLKLANTKIINADNISLLKKPQEGYQLDLSVNGQTQFQSYMDPKIALVAIIPNTKNSKIVITNIKDKKEVLTLSYDEIVKNAQKQQTAKPLQSQPNVAKDALYLTWQQIKARGANHGLSNVPTNNTNESRVIATSSEMVVWYTPKDDSYAIVILSKDFEGAKRRAYDWLKAYVKDVKSAKVTFTNSGQ